VNRLVIFLILGFAVIPFVISHAYSQSLDVPLILVQTTLRDSDGNLIAHLESIKFTHVNVPALNSFLDYEASRADTIDLIFEVGDKKFQLMKRDITITIDKEIVVASTLLFDNREDNHILLIRFAHDGYPAIPGDQLTSVWTFYREI